MMVFFLSFSCANKKYEPIKIGTNLWIGYEPLYLAHNLGYLSDVDVSMIEMPGASDVIRAFRNGLLDCAALTLDETYLLLQDSCKVKVLFIMDISEGADVLMARPDIKSFQELKGKKIAVENTAVGAYVLTRALEFGKVKPDEIQIISKIEAGHEHAYKSGEVDAVVTFEPTCTRLLEAGANILFDSRQIPDEIFDVFVVREELLNTRYDELQKIEEAWFMALDNMRNYGMEAISFSCKRMKMTETQFKNSLKGLRFPDKPENDTILNKEFLNSALKIEDIMIREDLLSRRVDPSLLMIKNKN